MIMLRKLALGAAAALAMGFAMAAPASALTLDTNSDRYIGTYSPGASGNDPFPQNLEIGEINSAALYKCDYMGGGCKNEAENFILSLGYENTDITFEFGDDLKTGTFTLNLSGNEKLLPHYLAIKGGTGFTLYDIADLTSATWTTLGLINNGGNQPQVSHLSFYNSQPSAIPLPAAGWLLIAGIASFAAIGRKRAAA